MKDSSHRWHSRYPYRLGAKRRSPGASRAAAISFKCDAWTRREQAVAYIGHCGDRGAICDEVASACDWAERYLAHFHLSELRAMGKIVPSGKVRRGVSGKCQTVWIVACGRASTPGQLCIFSLFLRCHATH